MRRNLRDFVEKAFLEDQFRTLPRVPFDSPETRTKLWQSATMVSGDFPLQAFYYLSAAHHYGQDATQVYKDPLQFFSTILRTLHLSWYFNPKKRELDTFFAQCEALDIVKNHRLGPPTLQQPENYTLEYDWNPSSKKESIWGLPHLIPGYNSYNFWTRASMNEGFPGLVIVLHL